MGAKLGFSLPGKGIVLKVFEMKQLRIIFGPHKESLTRME
jgi:hypothetical protein